MIGKVLFIKRNAKGIWGIIKCDDESTHYFDTSCILKGNYLKTDDKVGFDVIPSYPGKTQAINIKLIINEKQYPQLENSKLENLLHILNNEFSSKSFIDFPCLPDLFKTASIDYKEYAENLNSFIKKYLFQYCVKREYPVEGKTYPTVLVKKDSIEITKDQPADFLYIKKCTKKVATLNSYGQNH